MASAGDSHTVQRHQQCSLCLDRYSSPRILPCFHTFCLACLHRLVQTTRSVRTFPCPTCRSITQIPKGGVEKFQVNFYIEAFMENLQISQGGNPVNCNICGIHTATSKCVECDQFACNSCAAAHSKIGATRSHTVLSLNSISEATRLVAKERFCGTHKDEKVRFYCTQCHCLLCRDCKLTAHEGHPAVDISERSEAAKKTVLNVTEKCRVLAPQLKTSLLKAEKHQADLAKKESEILSTFRRRADEIRETVDSCLKQAEASLAGQSLKLQKQVSKTMEEMQQQIACLESLCEHAEQVVRAGCDTDILSLPEQMSTFFGYDLPSAQSTRFTTKAGYGQQKVCHGRENTKFEYFTNETWFETINLAGSQSTGQDRNQDRYLEYQDSNQKRGHLKELITEKIGKTNIEKARDFQCLNPKGQRQASRRRARGEDQQQPQAASISQAITDIQGCLARWAEPCQAQPLNAMMSPFHDVPTFREFDSYSDSNSDVDVQDFYD